MGENRDRFLRLVEDIKNRKDDYAAQLSSLILAGKSGSSALDEDSERGIMDSLLTPKLKQEKKLQVDKEEKLWQARLVLAIGEILDQEEEEIARSLAILDDDQANLFKELNGDSDELEPDNPFAELSQLEHNLNAANSGNIKKRFNGWKTLFLESDLPECEIFVTTSQDGGDLLLESYEKKTNRSAPLIAKLELPGLIGWTSEEAFQSALRFSEQNKEILSVMHKILTDLLQKEDTAELESQADNAFSALIEQWNAQLESVTPSKMFGRISVNYYLFPGLACSEIIGKTRSINNKSKNGLLVVMS